MIEAHGFVGAQERGHEGTSFLTAETVRLKLKNRSLKSRVAVLGVTQTCHFD